MSDQVVHAEFAEFGDDVHRQLVELGEAMRSAAVALNPDPEDWLNHSSLMMTAATMLAGTLYGQMVGAGVEDARPRRLRDVCEMMVRNFKSGIDVGVRRVNRLRSETMQ
jgi:hypothetical protein